MDRVRVSEAVRPLDAVATHHVTAATADVLRDLLAETGWSPKVARQRCALLSETRWHKMRHGEVLLTVTELLDLAQAFSLRPWELLNTIQQVARQRAAAHGDQQQPTETPYVCAICGTTTVRTGGRRRLTCLPNGRCAQRPPAALPARANGPDARPRCRICGTPTPPTGGRPRVTCLPRGGCPNGPAASPPLSKESAHVH